MDDLNPSGGPLYTRLLVRRVPGLLRVPLITAPFWFTKLVTTGVGEASSDYLVHRFDPVRVVAVSALAFMASLALQLAAGRYVPWRYWTTVSMVAVFGTMVADAAHVALGIPYLVSATVLAIALAGVFAVWRRVENTVSVHSITTTRRELLYWTVVMVTFALGTAIGDLTATTFGLGYLGSAVLFGALFVPAIVAHHLATRSGRQGTAWFWWAYILTRPLGASVADWLAVSPARGGLDLGSAWISAVGLGVIAVSVAVMTSARSRETPSQEVAA